MTAVIGYLRFRIVLLEPGGVTDPIEPVHTEDADAPPEQQLRLDRDPDDRICLPATTVAGALRAHLRHARGPEFADRLLGSVPPAGAPDSERAVPSAISVLHTRLVGAERASDRTTTALDVARAAADPATLRVTEHAHPDTTWEVDASWTDPDANAWAQVLDDLATWTPLLGRGVSTGHGQAVVASLAAGRLDLRRDEDLLTYLTRSGPDLVDSIVEPVDRDPAARPAAPTPEMLCEIGCTIEQALHIGTGHSIGERPAVAEFLTTPSGAPMAPGTALKGLLRARIAYILRSVGARPDPCTARDCGKCFPCTVFGYGGRPARKGEPTTAARARIRILDAPIDGTLTTRVHAPIDRFTGGVAAQTVPGGPGAASVYEAAGQLHSEQVVESGTFTIRVHDLDLDPTHRLLLLGVLRLALADLDDGLITLGRGGTRGFGRVSVAVPDELPTVAQAQRILRSHVERQESSA